MSGRFECYIADFRGDFNVVRNLLKNKGRGSKINANTLTIHFAPMDFLACAASFLLCVLRLLYFYIMLW